MMEAELVSETLVFDLALMQLYVRENFITLIHRSSFKSYIMHPSYNLEDQHADLHHHENLNFTKYHHHRRYFLTISLSCDHHWHQAINLFTLGNVAEQVSPQKRLHGGAVFVESIPKTLSGKILRRELRKSKLWSFRNTIICAKYQLFHYM
jgi:acyl-CoA synthetase (AMP-forming)/AMP-acid ligase II